MTETKLSEILEKSFVRCRDLEAPLADRLQAFANELRRLGPRFDAASRRAGQPPRGESCRSDGA